MIIKIKKLLSAISIVLLLLITSTSGCLDSSANEKSLFIGVWKMLEPEGEEHNITLIFYQNDTFKQTFEDNGQHFTFWGVYKIEKNQIITSTEDQTSPLEGNYEFSNEGKRLTIYDESISLVFEKILDDTGD